MDNSIRLSRLFRADGRSVVVALDHGAIVGPQAGWEDPSSTIETVVKAQPDAVIVTAGIAKRYASLIVGKVGVILSIPQTDDLEKAVDFATKSGADAVKLFVSVGSSDEPSNVLRLWHASVACYDRGMPLVAEMFPVKNEKMPNPTDSATVAKYARIGMEYGADVVKTFYTGSPESFRQVVRTCPAPILILGGEKKTDAQLLTDVHGAMQAGAAGVAIGRNVWQHTDPRAMAETIIGIVHGKWAVKEALKALHTN